MWWYLTHDLSTPSPHQTTTTGAYDDEEEEEEEGDEGSVYHDATAGPYSRGEEKASASSYHYQGRGVGGGGGIVRGSAVSAVMAATRDYQVWRGSGGMIGWCDVTRRCHSEVLSR